MSSIQITKDPSNPTVNFSALAESIVKVGSTYYTTYRGIGAPYVVGYASAPAPEGPWTNQGTLLSALGTGWESGSTGIDTSMLLLDGSTIHLYYNVFTKGIGHASMAVGSFPGGAWTRDAANPVLPVGTAGAWDDADVRGPSVCADGSGGYVMAYSGSASGETERRIGYATRATLSGVWTKALTNPILNVGSSGAWDDVIVDHPHLWREPASELGGAGGRWALMYTGAAGVGGGSPVIGFPWGVGIATAANLTLAALDGPWTKHAQNPFLPPGGSGTWDEGGPFRGGVWTDEGPPYTMMYAGLNAAATVGRSGTALLEFVPDDNPQPVAWDIYAADDLHGPILATITGHQKRTFRAELAGPGYGEVVISRHAEEATAANFAKGNLVRVRLPEVSEDYIFAFFLEQGDFTLLDASEEEGGELLTFGGRGALSYLDRARMWSEAFTTGNDISDTWTEVWETHKINAPVGSCTVGGDDDFLYVIGGYSRRVYKLRQSDRAIVRTSPPLWSGSDNYAGGLCEDPSDSTIMWALESPWALGGSGNTKIRKVRISDWAILATFDLGSAVQLTDIEADGTSLWTSKYDGPDFQQRSKATGAVTASHSISYGGVAQTKCTGLSINGAQIAIWFSGTKRALIASTAAPTVITDVIKTTGLSAFGGSWRTEGGQDYFYPVSYTADAVWKYQITSSTPHDPVDGVWRLDEANPGAILARLMAEWQSGDRPQQPIPEADYDFDFTQDSTGDPWDAAAGTVEFSAAIGDLGMATALRLTSYGLVLQMSPLLELEAYNPGNYGTDRTSASFGAGKVRLRSGVNIVERLLRRLDDRRVDTHMLAQGEGKLFATAVDNDLGYVREGFITTDLTSAEALEGTAAAELAQERSVADALALQVAWGDDEAAGLYMPGPAGTDGHYWVGDLVRLHTGTGPFDYNEQDFTVYAITCTEEREAWRALVELSTSYFPDANASDGGTGAGGGITGGGGSVGAGSKGSTSMIVRDTATGDEVVAGTIESDWGVTQPADGVARVWPRSGAYSGLTDVDMADLEDGQIPVWDADQELWLPGERDDHWHGKLRPEATITSEKSASNPTWPTATVPEGKIIRVGSTYYCPYTTSFGGGDGLVWLATAPSPDGPWSAGTSIFDEDDITWRSSHAMYAPYLVQGPDDRFYLFMSLAPIAGATSPLNAISMAVADVITGPYTEHGSAVFAPDTAGAWDSRRVGEVSVIYRGGKWIMAYMGEDSDLPYQESEQIGVAIADAPEGPYTRSALNPVLPFGTGGSWDDSVVADPDIDYVDGHYVIMYVGGPTSPFPHGNDCSQGLAFATDPAGPYTRYSANPVLPNGDAGAFDEALAFRGSLYREDDTWYVVYCGYNLSGVARGGNARLVLEFEGYVPPEVAADVALADLDERFTATDVEGGLRELAIQAEAIEGELDEVPAIAAAAAAVALDAIEPHVHIVDEVFSGDAATTVFVLANRARPDSVMAWVAGVRTPVTLGGTLNDEVTFGSAPASGTDNVSIDYAAVLE